MAVSRETLATSGRLGSKFLKWPLRMRECAHLLVLFFLLCSFIVAGAGDDSALRGRRGHVRRLQTENGIVRDLERLNVEKPAGLGQTTTKLIYGAVLGGLMGLVAGRNAADSSGITANEKVNSVAGSVGGYSAAGQIQGMANMATVEMGGQAGGRLLNAVQAGSNGAFGGGVIATAFEQALTEGSSGANPPGMDELNSTDVKLGDYDQNTAVAKPNTKAESSRTSARDIWLASGGVPMASIIAAGWFGAAVVAYFGPELLQLTQADNHVIA